MPEIVELHLIVRDDFLCIESRQDGVSKVAIKDRRDCGIIVHLQDLKRAVRKIENDMHDRLLKEHGFELTTSEQMQDALDQLEFEKD